MSSQGYQSQLAMDADAVDNDSEAYEFVRESLRRQASVIDAAGLRGSRSRVSGRTREGTETVGGQIVLHASPAMLDRLLPRILGADEDDDSFALADTLPDFTVMVDRVARVFTYGGCIVGKAVFRGQAGGLIELVLDLLGKSETVSAAGSFPSLDMPLDPPYVFHDGVLTIAGQERAVLDFELTIDNLARRHFHNSRTATHVVATDRLVTFRCRNPFTADEADLYALSAAGTAASLVLANGGYSTTFTMPALQLEAQSPEVAGRHEIPLVLAGTARATSSGAELTVTHDAAG